jgi:hypothetical protein
LKHEFIQAGITPVHDQTPHDLRRVSLTHHLARLVWVAFILTFIAARATALLRSGFHLQVGGTHLHHLNIGIILLAAMGGYLLFTRPSGRALRTAALLYGVALALTFDEFGMWLHLEDEYWQRASYDAVGAIAAFLGLLAAGPTLRRVRRKYWATVAGAAIALVLFGLLILKPFWSAG